MNKLNVKFAKLIIASIGENPDISDVDALAFVKLNLFTVKTLEGKEIVSLKDMQDMLNTLGGSTSNVIEIGDAVHVKTEDAEVDGHVKEIKYIVSGLGNKHYNTKQVTKL